MINNNRDFGILQLKLSNTTAHNNLIDTTSNFISNRPNSHIVLFNSYSDIINNKNVPILHISQGKLFYGKIIVFDIESLNLALNFVNKSEIVYYATNVPWENSTEKFSYWHSMFMHKDVKIVASNQNIYSLFSIGFKTPISIASEFSYEAFKYII